MGFPELWLTAPKERGGSIRDCLGLDIRVEETLTAVWVNLPLAKCCILRGSESVRVAGNNAELRSVFSPFIFNGNTASELHTTGGLIVLS